MKKKILGNFCIVYKIIFLLFSPLMNVLQNAFFLWCNDCQDYHLSPLTENVTMISSSCSFSAATSWIPHALSAQQLLTCSVASQEWYINILDLEMLINGKWSSTGLRIQTDSIAWKLFQICKERCCSSLKTWIVDQEVVSSNFIYCRWVGVFHI